MSELGLTVAVFLIAAGILGMSLPGIARELRWRRLERRLREGGPRT